MHNSLVSCTEPVWKANKTLASGHKTRFQVNNLRRNLVEGGGGMLPLPSAAQKTLCCCSSAPQPGSAPRTRLPPLRDSSARHWFLLSSSLAPRSPHQQPHLFPWAPEVRPKAQPHLITQILEDAFAAIRTPGEDQVYINYTLFSS